MPISSHAMTTRDTRTPRRLPLFPNTEPSYGRNDRIAKQPTKTSAMDLGQTIKIQSVQDTDTEEFRQIYDLYRRIFTLEEETESFDGLCASMALNGNPDLKRQYGPFQEIWLSARTPEGRLAGGADFNVFILPEKACATVHITYIFTDACCRQNGIGSSLLQHIESEARRWVASQGFPMDYPLHVFCEQNAPEQMSPEEYRRDAETAGLDPCQRLIWWHKKGFRRLDTEYVQPPLSPQGKACTNLSLNVKTSKRLFPSAIVSGHLRRFFYIAVFKARTSHDAQTEEILRKIEATGSIPVTGSLKEYRELGKRFSLQGRCRAS